LQVIAQGSGCTSIYPQNTREPERYFRELSDAIRSHYVIAYKPGAIQ